MLTVTLLKTLFDYTYWAQHLVWDKCIAQLDDETFTQEVDLGWGSVRNQCVHLMSTEWTWINRLNGVTPDVPLDPANFVDRAAVRVRWDHIEATVRGFVVPLRPMDITRTFTYRASSGQTYTQGVGEILLHMVNHGTDHRAQMIAMLHHLGAPTVEQDLIFYLRERDERQGRTQIQT